MFSISPKHKVYLAIQAVDFRCGIDGLAAICSQQFSLDPFNGHYFIFRNRRGSSVKILTYDTQGFWLMQKRLSKGSFRHWPKDPHSMVILNATQLQVLLQNGNPDRIETAPPWRLITD